MYLHSFTKDLYALENVLSLRASSNSGKASILIPSPYVAENHQYHNAMALVNRNAARIIEEKDLSSESLTSMLDGLLASEGTIKEIEKNAKAMAVLDSRERIAEVITYLAN